MLDDLVDLSAQIEADITKYENLLAQAQKIHRLPLPDGSVESGTVEIIPSIVTELRKLQSSLKVK